MEFVGWVLIVLGILFMLAGLVQAFTRDIPAAQRMGEGDLPIGDIILELIKGGLGIVAVGVLMLLIGLDMAGLWDAFGEEESGSSGALIAGEFMAIRALSRRGSARNNR